MVAALLTALLGLCNDKSAVDCHEWAKAGECETNHDFMAKACPVSCGICSTNCTDASEHCVEWAQKGECTDNKKYMLRTCPIACGLCTPPCVDTNGGIKAGPDVNESTCAMWARLGACDDNPDYALRHCPVSCGICGKRCIDLHASCSAWSANGECKTNAAFMQKQCPRACGICKGSQDAVLKTGPEDQPLTTEAASSGGVTSVECIDKHGVHSPTEHDANCETWRASGECESNAEFMLRECAATCGLCRTVCTDHDVHCTEWAKAGECSANQAFMHKKCPASCGVCSRLIGKLEDKEEL